MTENLKKLSKQNLIHDLRNWQIETNFKQDKGYIFRKSFIYRYEQEELDKLADLAIPTLNWKWKNQKRGFLLSTRFLPWFPFESVKLKWIVVPSKFRRPTVDVYETEKESIVRIDAYFALIGFWRGFTVILWLILAFIVLTLFIAFLWNFL